MPSQFELIAAIIRRDKFMQTDEENAMADVLIDIMRACHDYNGSPKWEVSDLAETIVSIVANAMVCEDLYFPEDEGSGPTDWAAADAAWKEPSPAIATPPQGAIGA